MFLNKLPRLNLTQRFLVFFTLTTLLPFLILGNLYLNQTTRTLREKTESKLRTAEVLIEQQIHAQCQQLKLLSEHVIADDILPNLLPINTSMANSSQATYSQKNLEKIQHIHHLSFLALLSADKKIISKTASFKPEFLEKSNLLIDDALKKHMVIVDTIKTSNKQTLPPQQPECKLCQLMDIAIVPLKNKATSQLIGILIVGRQNAIPAVGKMKLAHLVGTTAQMVDDNKVLEMKRQNKSLNIHGNDSASQTLMIQNEHHQDVGAVNVSVDTKRLNQFEQQQVNFFSLGLLILLFALTVIGLWFSRCFVDPLRSITEACHQVALGNMEIRIPAKYSRGDMRQTITTVNRMLESLNQTEMMRRNFISTLSHDLKTPLLAQARVLSLIEESTTSPQNKNMLEKLLQNNQQLLDMVVTLLETYQQDNEPLIPHYQNTNLHTTVDNTLQLLQALADQKEITLENQLPRELFCMVDQQQIQRALQNLIGNAIENIQRTGKVWVAGKTSGEQILLSVCDNGPGIEADYLPILFDRYAGGLQRKKKVGSGLGLFIVHSIVTAHHSTIIASSNPGVLTEFEITLPIEPTDYKSNENKGFKP